PVPSRPRVVRPPIPTTPGSVPGCRPCGTWSAGCIGTPPGPVQRSPLQSAPTAGAVHASSWQPAMQSRERQPWPVPVAADRPGSDRSVPDHGEQVTDACGGQVGAGDGYADAGQVRLVAIDHVHGFTARLEFGLERVQGAEP